MCGIAGWYRRAGGCVPESVLNALNQALVHRGPDDQGRHIDQNFGFCMRRLSIIDIAGGHQPMHSPDGRLSIVFNGEIYNHLDLRRKLEAQGAAFQTRSDTEVILNGYSIWGHEIWAKLEGMFAVAIWDSADRSLHLARDSLGIKPLFVSEQLGGVGFASELKALYKIPNFDFTPNRRAIHDYFTLGYVLPPRTIYQEAYKVDPGHVLTFKADGRKSARKFWSFSFRIDETLSEDEWIDQFREKWLAVVSRHLLADVPVGTFLSGGVDSSAVTAAMSKVSNEKVTAFTIGFRTAEFDETRHAERIVQHLGIEQVKKTVEPEDAARILPRIVDCYDEPFADPSAIPTWYLSQLAAEHVKVVLAGDGGDELFAGYTRYRSERLTQHLQRLPQAIGHLFGATKFLPRLPMARWNYMRDRLQRVAGDTQLSSPIARFFSKNSITSPTTRAWLYHADFKKDFCNADEFERLEAEYFPEQVSRDPVERFLCADTTVRLPGVMLTKVDRASMAHSLEVRVPFLSHEFVDWACTVPMRMKLRGATGKWLVRRGVEPWLPSGILERPKQGFSVPLAEWVRGDFGRYAETIWSDSGVADAAILNATAVSQLFAEHRSGRSDHSLLLYALVIFCLWWMGAKS